MTYHTPVMLHECMQALNIDKDGFYVDATAGGGGHSRAILQRLSPKGMLLGFDQDGDSPCSQWRDDNFRFVRSNFRFLSAWLDYYEVDKVDGILLDLGVSSHQLDQGERGFAFRLSARLDMRMNQRQALTAAKILAEYSEAELADVFWQYGECRYARVLAKKIVSQRKLAPITRTEDLKALVEPYIAGKRYTAEMAKVFQALRIEVNGEMNALKEVLRAAERRLAPRGRLVVLSYHSVEDRIVKVFLRPDDAGDDPFAERQDRWKAIRVAKQPSREEVEKNPRSRSARLRVAERRS